MEGIVNLKPELPATVGDEVTSLHLDPPTAELRQSERFRDSSRRLLLLRGAASGLTGQGGSDILTKMQLLQMLIIRDWMR